MSSFRDVECSRCHKTFNYLYKGGRPKKTCSRCKPWRNKSHKVFNAYDTTVFYGIELPEPWELAKNGKGNIVRWFRGRFVTLFDQHSYFSVAISSRESGQGQFRNSQIRVVPENVSEAISWSQKVVGSFLDSLSCQ